MRAMGEEVFESLGQECRGPGEHWGRWLLVWRVLGEDR